MITVTISGLDDLNNCRKFCILTAYLKDGRNGDTGGGALVGGTIYWIAMCK